MRLRRPIPLAATIAAVGLVGCNEDSPLPIGGPGGSDDAGNGGRGGGDAGGSVGGGGTDAGSGGATDAGGSGSGGGTDAGGGGQITPAEALLDAFTRYCETVVACEGDEFYEGEDCASYAAEYVGYFAAYYVDQPECVLAYAAYLRCFTDNGECVTYDYYGEHYASFRDAGSCDDMYDLVEANCDFEDPGYYDY